MTSKVNVIYNHSSGSEDEYHSDSSIAGDVGGSSDDDSATHEVTRTTGPPKKGPNTSAVANVMAKILGKNVPQKNTAILSKGATDKALQKKRKAKEDEKDSEDGQVVVVKKEKTDDVELSSPTTDVKTEKLKKSVWENMGRVKPSVLDRESERTLQRIATRGVVQLFNAVKKQQKMVEDRLAEAGGVEYRKDKVMESMTKGRFMDVLKGTAATSESALPGSTRVKTEKTSSDTSKVKQEPGENPSWSVLRDDFMMGAKMKDWDKESADSEGVSGSEDDDDSGPDS